MNEEFMAALQQVEKEKGIPRHILIEAIESALVSAYKKDQKDVSNIRVQMEPDTGAMHVYGYKNIVGEVEDPQTQCSLEEAQKLDPHYSVGDVAEQEIQPREFGRIAAQTAKQVVVQRIREAERILIYEEYVNREGDIVTGIVQRFEQRNVLLDLGKADAILTQNEQVTSEHYEQGLRLKVYIVEVRKTTKGPQIFVSRTHPGLLKRLFELEVPEIHDGIVEIKSIAREAGARSKVTVWSREENVDPVGSCVGARGSRVQNIVRELRGEKIDIISWDPDPRVLIANALSPAKVTEVRLAEDRKSSMVIVPDNLLSLAIGREGQNARLAAKLTGWKIDIKSESQAAEIDRIAFEEEQARLLEIAENEAQESVDAADVDADGEFQPEGDLPAEWADADAEEFQPLPGDEAGDYHDPADAAQAAQPKSEKSAIHLETDEDETRMRKKVRKKDKKRREKFEYFEDDEYGNQ